MPSGSLAVQYARPAAGCRGSGRAEGHRAASVAVGPAPGAIRRLRFACLSAGQLGSLRVRVVVLPARSRAVTTAMKVGPWTVRRR
ncbi:MAG: hypothetical protein QOD41_2870 [Cryptosporangiaceae bacterium]|nr:hypothetical protein [Cryptosporangiaceae bacterium]